MRYEFDLWKRTFAAHANCDHYCGHGLCGSSVVESEIERSIGVRLATFRVFPDDNASECVDWRPEQAWNDRKWAEWQSMNLEAEEMRREDSRREHAWKNGAHV